MASSATTIIDMSFTNNFTVSSSGSQIILCFCEITLMVGSPKMKYILFAINPNSGE